MRIVGWLVVLLVVTASGAPAAWAHTGQAVVTSSSTAPLSEWEREALDAEREEDAYRQKAGDADDKVEEAQRARWVWALSAGAGSAVLHAGVYAATVGSALALQLPMEAFFFAALSAPVVAAVVTTVAVATPWVLLGEHPKGWLVFASAGLASLLAPAIGAGAGFLLAELVAADLYSQEAPTSEQLLAGGVIGGVVVGVVVPAVVMGVMLPSFVRPDVGERPQTLQEFEGLLE